MNPPTIQLYRVSQKTKQTNSALNLKCFFWDTLYIIEHEQCYMDVARKRVNMPVNVNCIDLDPIFCILYLPVAMGGTYYKKSSNPKWNALHSKLTQLKSFWSITLRDNCTRVHHARALCRGDWHLHIGGSSGLRLIHGHNGTSGCALLYNFWARWWRWHIASGWSHGGRHNGGRGGLRRHGGTEIIATWNESNEMKAKKVSEVLQIK